MEVNPQCELGTSLLGQDPAKRFAALSLSLSLSLSQAFGPDNPKPQNWSWVVEALGVSGLRSLSQSRRSQSLRVRNPECVRVSWFGAWDTLEFELCRKLHPHTKPNKSARRTP